LECTNQTGCSWYLHSVGAFGGTCSANTTTPTTNVPGGSYSKATSCPTCQLNSACSTCTANENSTTCGWYVLPGATGGKCREASPGFAYSKVTATFCGGNVCAGVQQCTDCKNVSAVGGGAAPCAWYTPVSGLGNVYNAKCDIDSAGVVSNTLYDKATTCPPCGGTTCTACQGEAGCEWKAVTVATVQSFGQCVTKGVAVAGKTVVAVCAAACKLYTCTSCIAKPECRWYTGSSAQDDSCDLATDSIQHPFMTALTVGGACPACKSSRCFECGKETGCGWYVNTVPGIGTEIPNSGDCAPTAASHTNEKLIASTDKKCDGGPNSASALSPGFLALLGLLFVYYN